MKEVGAHEPPSPFNLAAGTCQGCASSTIPEGSQIQTPRMPPFVTAKAQLLGERGGQVTRNRAPRPELPGGPPARLPGPGLLHALPRSPLTPSLLTMRSSSILAPGGRRAAYLLSARRAKALLLLGERRHQAALWPVKSRPIGQSRFYSLRPRKPFRKPGLPPLASPFKCLGFSSASEHMGAHTHPGVRAQRLPGGHTVCGPHCMSLTSQARGE